MKVKKLLPERVAEQIISLIADRALKTGDKLPNEFDMAQQLSVGRGTIREAVKILVSRNILEIRRGCGTFVCENPGVVDDPLGFAFVDDKKRLGLDLCEVRMIIEPEIAALAAERAVPEEIEELQRIQDEVKELCDKEELHMHKDIEFHEMLAKMSKNLIMPNNHSCHPVGYLPFYKYHGLFPDKRNRADPPDDRRCDQGAGSQSGKGCHDRASCK